MEKADAGSLALVERDHANSLLPPPAASGGEPAKDAGFAASFVISDPSH
jgi:hypothetical protein